MNRNIHFLFLLMCFMYGKPATAQVVINGDLENIDPKTKLPVGWNNFMGNGYTYKLDSTTVKQGKYSVSITSGNEGEFGAINVVVPHTFSGHTLKLQGFIKTENVTGGNVGLWLRVDGTKAFDNMNKKNINGTTDWRKYTITLPYQSNIAENINVGALITGKGKMWFDDIRLYLDGIPIEKAAIKPDAPFAQGSGISTIPINQQQIRNLTLLGQVWGFVKYHHPAVTKGEVNMDDALFRVMPAVINAKNDTQLSNALEKWVDGFGVPPVCHDCTIKVKESDIKLKPDYGMIFNNKVLSESLTKKLTYILNNRNTVSNFYIDIAPNVNNPIFQNEKAYRNFPYPDPGYRLLCLYRFWNMIQYFWPYKHLIGEDWNKVLSDCIPGFAQAANEQEYVLNTLALVARIHDTHANILTGVKTLSDFRGKFGVPLQAKFIEDKLVVTGYYNDTLNIKKLVKIGDVIESINGEPVANLVKKFLPYTPASNYSTQLRDMPRTYLLRANNADFKLGLLHNNEKQNLVVTGIPIPKLNYRIDFDPYPKSPGYYLLDNNIGYVFPGRYKNADLPKIKKLFARTKGIIVDMRCYPAEFMPFTFVPYIKTGNPDFVKFTKISVSNPGVIAFSETIQSSAHHQYNGKVVVIVNEMTQSQAEYTTVALQSSTKVIVIGSTTAGADGDVSQIVLPGNIITRISGLGVYYPDGTETQRKGVKIDEVIKPTIAGIKVGRDELLERAKNIIMQ